MVGPLNKAHWGMLSHFGEHGREWDLYYHPCNYKFTCSRVKIMLISTKLVVFGSSNILHTQLWCVLQSSLFMFCLLTSYTIRILNPFHCACTFQHTTSKHVWVTENFIFPLNSLRKWWVFLFVEWIYGRISFCKLPCGEDLSRWDILNQNLIEDILCNFRKAPLFCWQTS